MGGIALPMSMVGRRKIIFKIKIGDATSHITRNLYLMQCKFDCFLESYNFLTLKKRVSILSKLTPTLSCLVFGCFVQYMVLQSGFDFDSGVLLFQS